MPLQADRQHDIPHQHRRPTQPKDGFLVEQVFSPHPYPASLKAHMRNNPLYTDMRLTELAEVRRGQPSWTTEEHTRNPSSKGKLTALDLQVSIWRSWGGWVRTPYRCREGLQRPRPPCALSTAPGPTMGFRTSSEHRVAKEAAILLLARAHAAGGRGAPRRRADADPPIC